MAPVDLNDTNKTDCNRWKRTLRREKDRARRNNTITDAVTITREILSEKPHLQPIIPARILKLLLSNQSHSTIKAKDQDTQTDENTDQKKNQDTQTDENLVAMLIESSRINNILQEQIKILRKDLSYFKNKCKRYDEEKKRTQTKKMKQAEEKRTKEDLKTAEAKRKAKQMEEEEERRKKEDMKQAEEKRTKEDLKTAEAKRKAKQMEEEEERRKKEDMKQAEEKRTKEDLKTAETKRKAKQMKEEKEDIRKAKEQPVIVDLTEDETTQDDETSSLINRIIILQKQLEKRNDKVTYEETSLYYSMKFFNIKPPTIPYNRNKFEADYRKMIRTLTRARITNLNRLLRIINMAKLTIQNHFV